MTFRLTEILPGYALKFRGAAPKTKSALSEGFRPSAHQAAEPRRLLGCASEAP